MPRETNFDYPADTPVTDDRGILSVPWGQVFTRWQAAIGSIVQSGTTANRPTSILWIGRSYYDTTLNKPVYVSAVKPTVWRDAAGTIV